MLCNVNTSEVSFESSLGENCSMCSPGVQFSSSINYFFQSEYFLDQYLGFHERIFLPINCFLEALLSFWGLIKMSLHQGVEVKLLLSNTSERFGLHTSFFFPV